MNDQYGRDSARYLGIAFETEDEARQTFVEKFGREPEETIVTSSVILVGPIPEERCAG